MNLSNPLNPAISFDLTVRYEIYRFFAEQGRAPRAQDIAERLRVTTKTVKDAFRRLHERHLIFVLPGTHDIRIANPFSAIPTRYQVRWGERTWWANCAWDALGIAAALNIDVHIEAMYPDRDEAVNLQVVDGRVEGHGHVIYFPLPFRRWYDDLIYT